MGLLKIVSELDDIVLKKVSRWGLPIMFILIIGISYGTVKVDNSDGYIPLVEIGMVDLSGRSNDSALIQAEYISEHGRPDFDLIEWKWTDGLPIVHAYAVYAIMPFTGGVNALLSLHILSSFLALLVIKRLTFRIWILQEFASLNLNLNVDLEELEEEFEEMIEDVGEMLHTVGDKIAEASESVSELDGLVKDPSGIVQKLNRDEAKEEEIAKKREEHEPSAFAHLFAVVSMFCYFFYMIQSSVSDIDSGIAMAQFFTLVAILLSTGRLEGKNPNKFLILLVVLLAILSSPVGVVVILPVLLFLVIGELSGDKKEKSFKQKFAMLLIVGIISGLASTLFVINLILDIEVTMNLMVSGFTDSLMKFAPLLAILSIIPFRRLLNPVERSFVMYGGTLFGLTFFLPAELIDQIHYTMIIPGSILAAFALVSMIEDFSSNLVEKIAVQSVKFCSTLGGIPVASTIIYASHQAVSKDIEFSDAVLSHFTTQHMIFILLGLAGFMFMIFHSRKNKEDEKEVSDDEKSDSSNEGGDSAIDV